jgi:hypothetical protein
VSGEECTYLLLIVKRKYRNNVLISGFDLVGQRLRTDFRVNSAQTWSDESFEIALPNPETLLWEVRLGRTSVSLE